MASQSLNDDLPMLVIYCRRFDNPGRCYIAVTRILFEPAYTDAVHKYCGGEVISAWLVPGTFEDNLFG